MSSLTRRQFGSILGLGTASIMLPPVLLGQSKPRVVIVGGGAGGATAARYLAKVSDGELDVTLIEDALENGQNIVMVAPPNPYRCPPGPYERVSMMAHMLKSKGFTDSSIYIIDSKPKFSKQGLFSAGWERHYPEMIEWFAPEIHGGIVAVDANAGTVETDLDTFECALLNVIPGQQAGAIAVTAGLTDDKSGLPSNCYQEYPDSTGVKTQTSGGDPAQLCQRSKK